MKYSLVIIAILVMVLSSCSGSSQSITTPAQDSPRLGSPINDFGQTGQSKTGVMISDYFPDGSPASGAGSLGLFNLHIDPISVSAELTSLRSASLPDVLEVVDITNFLQLWPCTDCAKIQSVSLDEDGNVVVTIGLKHPFEEGDPFKPITGRNRGDLHVFNVEGTIFSNNTATSFPGLGRSVANFRLLNASGYTGYLNPVIDAIYPTSATIHPYILHFDDYSQGNFDPDNPMGFSSVTDPPPSGNLVMAMGSDYDFKDYVFVLPDEPVDFIYAIGCTYAVSSAAKSQRFDPEYRVPQHLKKAASDVWVDIVENDLADGDTESSADVEIHVVDRSHGVEVGSGLDQMPAASDVGSILIELPGVMLSPLNIDGASSISGTGHDPSDPLVYQATITNTAGAPEGWYHGLIKVIDTYPPGLNESPLLDGMDGIKRVDPVLNPLEGLFAIPEFVTYQTFDIFVELGNEPPVAVLLSDPEPADITQFETVSFDATSSYDPDGEIVLYEFDFDWDGIEDNFMADESNDTGLATSYPYEEMGTYTAGLRVTDDFGAVDYDSVTIQVSELNVIFVDDSYTGTIHDGTMEHPYITIQEGLAAAEVGYEVWVDDSGNDYIGPITLKAGVKLKSVNWDTSDGGDMASIHSTATGPAVIGANNATIEGFKISGGGSVSGYGVVGVRILNVDTIIKDCWITDVISTSTSNGILIQNSTGSVIEGCTVSNIQNTSHYGMLYGIHLVNSPITVKGNVIHDIITTDNYHSLNGIYAVNCSPQGANKLEITQNRIYDVYTQGMIGGSYTGAVGIFLNSSNEATVQNNLVYDIQSGNYRYSTGPGYTTCGMRFLDSSDVTMPNNTIYNVRRNYYFHDAFGVLIQNSPNFRGTNNIVNRIKRDQHTTVAYGISGPPESVWEYNNVFEADSGLYVGGITPGTGSISANPMFEDPGTDFRLQDGSPCKNSGDPSIQNPDNTRSDMGCYGGPLGDW